MSLIFEWNLKHFLILVHIQIYQENNINLIILFINYISRDEKYNFIFFIIDRLKVYMLQEEFHCSPIINLPENRLL